MVRSGFTVKPWDFRNQGGAEEQEQGGGSLNPFTYGLSHGLKVQTKLFIIPSIFVQKFECFLHWK